MKKETNLFKRHYPELDLLRTVAIAMVMLRHFGARGGSLDTDASITRFILWGSQGVALFFVLSGFLIGGQIIEEVSSGGLSFKRFYLKRILRIFPPYYFSLFVVSVLFFAGIADDNVVKPFTVAGDFVKDIFYHVLYLQNYIPSPKAQNALYWSLGIEEQFYMAAPFLLLIFMKYSRRWLPVLLAVLLFMDLGVRFALYNTGKAELASFTLPFYNHFSTIAFGVLAAAVFIRYGNLFRSSWALRALLLSAIAVGIWMSLFVGSDEMNYFNICWRGPFTGLAFSALILWTTTGRSGEFIPFKGFFALIARLSYTMYLYHLMFITPLVAFSIAFWRVTSYFDLFVLYCMYFAVVAAFSAVVYVMVDRPFMAYRKRVVARMGGPDRPGRGKLPAWPGAKARRRPQFSGGASSSRG